MIISTQVEVVDEYMLLLLKDNLSQLSLGQSHYLSGWLGGFLHLVGIVSRNLDENAQIYYFD